MVYINFDEGWPCNEPLLGSVSILAVELLQGLVSRSLGGTVGQQMCSLSMEQEGVGPISLPRRAETFGGFDSHQMNVGKGECYAHGKEPCRIKLKVDLFPRI